VGRRRKGGHLHSLGHLFQCFKFLYPCVQFFVASFSTARVFSSISVVARTRWGDVEGLRSPASAGRRLSDIGSKYTASDFQIHSTIGRTNLNFEMKSETFVFQFFVCGFYVRVLMKCVRWRVEFIRGCSAFVVMMACV
jgi:hypothetical protein